MYLNFYQLIKKPFRLAPDPEFLYLSQQHKDALGAIIYGIEERVGFVSIVGEVGTGKTTIVRSFLHKTDRNKILPIFIFNSRITFSELMETLLHELGIDPEIIPGRHKVSKMVRMAYRAMLEKASQGKNLVLIVDEAQNMPIETLGKLCVLSNFETTKAKLIQIVLVGQPELQKKLDLYELRQLRQRIAHSALITPLPKKESIAYFYHRLSLSSREQRPIFTASAIRRIVKHSKGIPRVINILSENSLVAGYGLQEKPVSLKLVKQVIAEYEGKRFSGQLQFREVAVGTLILLLAVLLVASYVSFSPHHPNETIGEQVRIKIDPGSHQQPLIGDDRTHYSNKEVVAQIEDGNPLLMHNAQTILLSDAPDSTEHSAETLQPQPGEPFHSIHLADVSREPSTASVAEEQNLGPKAEPLFSLLPGGYITAKHSSSQKKIVKKGDTVSKLCLDTYGFYNAQVLIWLKRHNPHVFNMDEIQIGGILFFPEMESSNLDPMHQRVYSRSRTTSEEVALR